MPRLPARSRSVRASHPSARRLRLEPLEQRELLSATPLSDEERRADRFEAKVAALVDFDGPDGIGKDGPLAPIGFDLAQLYHEQRINRERHPELPFQASNSALVISGDRVRVDVVTTGSNQSAEQFAAWGMSTSGVAGQLVTGLIRVDLLRALAVQPFVRFARPSYDPITGAGAVTSQGDAALRADLARTTFGVTGSGITVGVISDSVNVVPYSATVDGVSGDIATGDLPADFFIVQDTAPGTDEARALAQIVHDVAPGAAILAATGNGGEANFANNIRLMAALGADVVVDDLGYSTEPFFQPGLIAQAVSDVISQGTVYVSSAGNAADLSYESEFRSSTATGPRGGILHDFDPGSGVSTLQQVTIPAGTTLPFSFQWDQPFASLGGIGSASDLDIGLIGPNGTLFSGIANNLGQDPLEFFSLFNRSNAPITLSLQIELVAGPTPGRLKYAMFGGGGRASIDTFATHSGTLSAHSNVTGAISVGAAAYYFTPSGGSAVPVLNDFSSRGGTPLLFDALGNRLAQPLDLGGPHVVGPDFTNTTFFGTDIPQDIDTQPNFSGTSASAPHVAGVAALMLQKAGGRRSLSSQQVLTLLEQTAIDIVSRRDPRTLDAIVPIDDGVGNDIYSGFGLVDAVAAIQASENQVSISSVTAFEGTGGVTDFVFTVSAIGPRTVPVVIAYSTAPNTASGSDFQTQSNSITFTAASPNSRTITIRVTSDSDVEPDETFFVNLDSVTNALPVVSQGVGTILNDDLRASILDRTLAESDGGAREMAFTVIVEGNNHFPLNLGFNTADGTAKAGLDYVARSGQISVPISSAPQTTVQVVVQILNDLTDEENETFFVNLIGNPQGDSQAQGTIVDNDPFPLLFVGNVELATDEAGQTQIVFPIALSRTSAKEVQVHFETIDGAAKVDQDYLGTTGMLKFLPGELTKLVPVTVLTTAAYAADRAFSLKLSEPINCTIMDGDGETTIIHDVPPAETAIVDDAETNFTHSLFGWSNATNLGMYHLDYTIHAAGDGSANATWTFPNLSAGNYEVLVHWVPYFNWASNAPFTVLDGSTPRGTVEVDQRLAPDDDFAHGFGWESLGTFGVFSGSLVVHLTDDADSWVIADAVRIVAGGVGAQTPEINVAGSGVSIDNHEPFAILSNGTDFGSVPASTGSTTRTFEIKNTGNAPMTIGPVSIQGNNASAFAMLKQPVSSLAPMAKTSFQVMFHPGQLGLHQASLHIANNDPDEGSYVIDVQGTGTPSGPLDRLIDEHTGSTQIVGAWTSNASTAASGGAHRSIASGNGSAHVDWRTSGLSPGNYDVYTTWVPFGNRATNASFVITGGQNGPVSVSVNQQSAPNDLVQEVIWERLASLFVSGGSIQVSLNNAANGFVIADAVWIVQTDLIPIVAPNLLHNLVQPLDVNNDGLVSPIDAVQVINHLMRLSAESSTPDLSPAIASAASTTSTKPRYIDVNGDGIVSPIDAMRVINHLMRMSAAAAAPPPITNAATTPRETAADNSAARQSVSVSLSLTQGPTAQTSSKTETSSTPTTSVTAYATGTVKPIDAKHVDAVFTSGSAKASVFGEDAEEDCFLDELLAE